MDRKQIITNGVVISVIGAVVLGATKYIFTETISTPLWLIVLLSFLSLCFVVVIIWKIKTPRYKNYKKDNFSEFGRINWEWDYELFGSTVINIKRYCPNDNTFLVSREWVSPTKTFFICETCGYQYGPFSNTAEQINWKIKRQIEKNIRNNFS